MNYLQPTNVCLIPNSSFTIRLPNVHITLNSIPIPDVLIFNRSVNKTSYLKI